MATYANIQYVSRLKSHIVTTEISAKYFSPTKKCENLAYTEE